MFLNLVFVRAVSPGLGPSFDQLIYTSSSPPAWRTCAAAECFFSRWDPSLGWMSYRRRPNPVSFANLFRVIASGHPWKAASHVHIGNEALSTSFGLGKISLAPKSNAKTQNCCYANFLEPLTHINCHLKAYRNTARQPAWRDAKGAS